MRYDYLAVGTGLFGAVFAYEMNRAGKSVLMIDKREHIGGNIYTREERGIQVHKYGAHIFHTSNRQIWEYINQFAEWNHYINSPIAVYGDELYNMPFNMNTFSRMWGIRTPKEAKEIIDAQRSACKVEEPSNLEEQALSLVGRDVYEKLVKGYTEKQWGKTAGSFRLLLSGGFPYVLPMIITILRDPYQGIPVGGYTGIIEKMLKGISVRLGISYRDFLKENENSKEPDTFDKVLYTRHDRRVL